MLFAYHYTHYETKSAEIDSDGPGSAIPLTSTQAAIYGTAQYSASVIPVIHLSESRALDLQSLASRVAHSFGSGKLYICLSNKCFKVYPVYSLCVTDVRP